MTFSGCVLECAANDEFVANFDRLQGRNLSRRGTGLDLAIDDATGRFEDDMAAFCRAVYDVVWTRIRP